MGQRGRAMPDGVPARKCRSKSLFNLGKLQITTTQLIDQVALLQGHNFDAFGSNTMQCSYLKSGLALALVLSRPGRNDSIRSMLA